MSILDMSTPREPTERTGNLLEPAEAAKVVNLTQPYKVGPCHKNGVKSYK